MRTKQVTKEQRLACPLDISSMKARIKKKLLLRFLPQHLLWLEIKGP